MSHNKRRYRLRKQLSLEDTLLNEEERAVLHELDQTFLRDDQGGETGREKKYRACLNCCETVISDKAIVSLVITFFIVVVGVALLALARGLDLPNGVIKLSGYIISAGVFGLASGGTNWIAILMLFYKLPPLIGSGVFYRQHKEIKDIIKKIVLHMLFDFQHLENYMLRKIRQFSSNVNVVENITQALNSPEAERVIDERLNDLYSQPEAHYLEVLGLSQEQLRPMIKPSVLSLCAESGPVVLDSVSEGSQDQAISISRFREEMDRYLSWRIEELTEKRVGWLMRQLMYKPLGWVVVWGCIFGVLIGVVIQALRISLNFNFEFLTQ